MKFRNRLTAIAAAICLFGAAYQGGVLAESGYDDYVAGERPENMIQGSSPAETYANSLIRNSGDIQAVKDSASELELCALKDVGENKLSGYIGFVFKTLKFDKDKSYVFTAKLKSGTEDTARVGISMTNEKANTTSYPIEYGADGIELDSEYKSVAVTIKPANGFMNDAPTHGLVLGFVSGTPAGTKVMLKRDEPESVYLAEESAYDIHCTLTSQPETVRQGNSIAVQAEVVNQVGSTGTLSQDFDWLVMDEEKTSEAQGFQIIPGADGAADIEIDESVPQGRYAVVAMSRDYEGFVKTAYIDVLRKQINDVDIQAEKPQNLILKPADPGFAEKTTTAAVNIQNGENSLIVSALQDVDNDLMKLDGIRIRTALSKGFASDFHFVPGKSYVISAKVRRAEESSEEKVRFCASFVQDSEETFALTKEYGEEGMELTGEWQDFSAAITIPESYDSSNKKRQLCMGMPNGTKAGSAFEIQLSVYVAEEIPMSMEFDSDSDTIGMENGASFSARLLNQLGCEGNLDQTFEWYVLDADRSEKTEELVLKTDENNAEVFVSDLTEPGEYYIVAEITANGETARKCLKLTADKPEVWKCVESLINSLSENNLADHLDTYTDKLKIDFIPTESRDAAILARLLKKETPIASANEEEFLKLIQRATAISLYRKNDEHLSLYQEDGNFAYADELNMKQLDQNGITVNQLFEEGMTAEGRKKVQSALCEKSFSSIGEFEKAFALETILKAIAYPKLEGSGYVADVLTKENTDFVGISADSYIKATDKTAYNKKLARNNYTKASELENAIIAAKPSDNGNGNGNGGHSGITGGGSAPSGGTVNVAPAPEVQEQEQLRFSDVDEKYWAYADIYHLRERGIIEGVDERTFAPEGTVTREQFAKMLCSVMGYDLVNEKLPYTDVDENAWYAPYAAAAVRNQVIYGTDSVTFGVGMPITRQDLCVVLWRALGSEEIEDGTNFTDSEAISDYASEAVTYMSAFGIINGYDDGTFRPKDYCTRAQCAKILCTILNMKGLSQ